MEWNYDAHGNCLSEINKAGDAILRTFDANDNCLTESGPRQGLKKSYQYDWMNRCIYQSTIFRGEKVSETHTAYDLLGRPCSIVDEYGQETKYQVDRWGHPCVLELPLIEVEGTLQKPLVRQAFDHFGNLISHVDPLNRTTTNTYTSRSAS